jgi:serine protease AprX
MIRIPLSPPPGRRKAVWGPKRTLAAALVAILGAAPTASAGPKGHRVNAGRPNHFARDYRLDDELESRSRNNRDTNTTRVIVELKPGAEIPREFSQYVRGGRLDVINGQVVELPNGLLKKFASHGEIFRVHYDRPIEAHNYRTAVTVGARTVLSRYGYTGYGVGVAVIDSGITSWHDDLINPTSKSYPYGNQRVSKFVDFVNGRPYPYDDNGHGTHVSGIIGGLGYDSNGEKAGIAPLASLVSLKVLDANGKGSISNLIAALNWVAANYKTYNIRVVNMSVGASVSESYWTDPLTLAAKAVTDKGITVVTAAGNLGKNALGQLQWGGITAPGNAPWVLTVGASSTMGTVDRSDDQMAAYSSSGPTAFDFDAKPDLVAPGTGTISLLSAGSTFSVSQAPYIIKGSNGQPVYLALSGTSMAAPVVSGTVALMLQANPNLTPNLIKAILQYTAQVYPGYSPLREGAGFLDTYGAVRLAKFYANGKVGDMLSVGSTWSRSILWGNHRLKNGNLNPSANAFANGVVWGSAKTMVTSGDNIVWGTMSTSADNIVWGTVDAVDNIVWGTVDAVDNIVWGTSGALDNIVWGTAADTLDNIVWGTACGGADCDNIVWGTFDAVDNIVWGTADIGDNIVWGTSGLDNIVWATSADSDTTVFPDDVVDLPGTVIDLNGLATLPDVSATNPTSTLGGL